MNFLIALGAPGLEKIRNLQPSNYSSSDFGVANLSPCLFNRQDIYVVTSREPDKLQSGENEVILWDGSIVDHDTAFSTIMPVPDAYDRIKRYIESIKERREPTGYSGVFGCAQITNDGRFYIACDQLSQYAIFHAHINGTRLFSNSLHLIEKTAKLLNINISRDFASNAYEAAFGAGGWMRTGLSQVEKIPPNHFVSYEQGEVKFIPNVSSAYALQPSQAKYQSRIQYAAKQLKNSALALSKAFPEQGLVIDLSGGKDTRVLLGAQLATGEKNFHVFLGAQPGNPDYEVASNLVSYYDLDSAYFPSNIAAKEHISPVDVARRAAYRYMGTSNLYQSDVGLNTLSGVAKVRGGSAEGRTKAFFLYPDGKRKRMILRYGRVIKHGWGEVSELHRAVSKFIPNYQKREKLLTAMIMSRGKRGHFLFRTEFLQSAYKSVLSNIEWLREHDVAAENLADAYYIFDRGWRHCGFPVQVMNGYRTTFEPLNNIALLEAQFSLKTEGRQKARVSFDLFENFKVESLVEIPFENSTWPEEFFNSEGLDRRAALSNISSPKVSHQWITDTPGNAESIHTLGRSRYMREVKEYMLELATGLPVSHECWDYLKREELLKSISNDVFLDARFASTGVRLLHGFIWMAHEECRYPFDN